MITKDISNKDYATLKRFCKHYKFALIALTDKGCIVECNYMTQRLFNASPNSLQDKNLIEFCHLLSIDCPLKTLHPTIQTSSTYHHALETYCQWHAIKTQNINKNLRWILIGKPTAMHNMHSHTYLVNTLIDKSPLHIFSKNSDSVYIRCNHTAEQFAGMPMAGKVDYDFTWQDNANFLIESDQITLTGKSVLSLQALRDQNNILQQAFTIKEPIYDNCKNVVGVTGVTIVYETSGTPDNTITVLNKQHDEMCFNTKELAYISWLVKGKTAEEISMILNISKRTVERNLAQIRQKMHCQNQFQLGYCLARIMKYSN